MSWVSFLDRITQDNPEKLAVVEQATKRRLTYSDLLVEVKRYVSFLKSKNIQAGDRVVYCNTNSLEHLTLFLACARIGAIFVPMNWRLGDLEKKEIVERLEPKLALSKLENYEHYFNFPFVCLDQIDISAYPEDETLYASGEHDPLLILFTSGTSGTPKGVMFHGEMLTSNQEQTVKHWGLLANDITLVETPFFHTGGYNVLMLPLLSIGATVILAEKFEPNNFYETVENEKISVYFGVPTMFQELAHNPKFETANLKSLRFLISGGAHCSVPLIEKFFAKGLMFKQGFGLTEVGPNCFLLEEQDALRKVGSIGKPMSHSQVKLLKDNEEVGVGEIGELVIKGPHVCAGYYNNSNLFEESLYDGYFRTGDLAKFDDEGYYYIVGRKKDMYISGGENVYPAEVEKRLNTHPQIEDSVVVSVPDKKWGEVGMAFYMGHDLNISELREFLNPLLSRYKHPHYIQKVEHFPLLANGKIDKKALSAIALNSHGEMK